MSAGHCAWLCAIVAGLILLDGALAGSSESSQARGRKDKSWELAEKDDKGNNKIVGALSNASNELCGDDAEQWKVLIEEVNATSYNETLTSDEVIAISSYKIKEHLRKFHHLRKKFNYFKIGDWGDFSELFQVSTWITADFSESVIVLNNGKSELGEAILELENSSSYQGKKNALKKLRLEIEVVTGDITLSYKLKMVKLSKIFKEWFKVHKSYKEEVILIDIVGFGAISSFLDVADQHYRIDNFDSLFVVSSGESDVDLVREMEAEAENFEYAFSRSEKTQLGELISNIRMIAGDASLSAEKKVKAIVYQYSQLTKISSFLKFRLREFKVGLVQEFGTFGDFVAASSFSRRFHYTTTTTAPTTTTAAPGDCGKASEVVELYNGPEGVKNHSHFWESSDDYLKANPGTQATNYGPYLKNIQNTILLNDSYTAEEKIQKAGKVIVTYIGTSSVRADYLYAIEIKGNSSPKWGSYKHFCGCGGN